MKKETGFDPDFFEENIKLLLPAVHVSQKDIYEREYVDHNNNYY